MKTACRHFFSNDMPMHAAAVTYHILFSLFPFIIFFIALLGFLELSNLFDWLRERSEAFFLPQTMLQINQILDQLQQRRMGILSFGVLVALWAASSGMRSMMKALNVVYGVREGRPVWKRYSLSVFYTLGVAPQAMQALVQQVGIERVFATLWAGWLRWPAVVVLLTDGCAQAVFTLTPRHRDPACPSNMVFPAVPMS